MKLLLDEMYSGLKEYFEVSWNCYKGIRLYFS